MRAVEWKGGALVVLDQSKLPPGKAHVACKTPAEVAGAIASTRVRGAQSIGIAAAYGIAMAKDPHEAESLLRNASPTTADVEAAISFVLRRSASGTPALEAAAEWERRAAESCRKTGEHGSLLIRDGQRVLTHCSTGSLATNAHGTALGAIRKAWEMGKKIHVYVCETRPRLQGALTSMELLGAGVPHTVIADSAAGSLMRRGLVDLAMVGADRIARNGDFAGRSGTYPLAVLARECNVPFYVAAPLSSFDFTVESGDGIRVEERDGSEVLSLAGRRVYPDGARAYNPAFDVTPGRYVRSYVNEYGIFRNMKEIENIWRNARA